MRRATARTVIIAAMEQQEASVDRTGAEPDPLDQKGLYLLSLGMSGCYYVFLSSISTYAY